MGKPKIRFKGYTGDWEQRKVSEMCSIATGKSNTQDKIEDGEYPFYVRSPIIERSNKYLYDEEAVLTVGDGVGTGKVFHYVNGKYDLHQRCYRMYDFSDRLNAKYFFQVFSKMFYRRVMAMTAKTSVDSVRMEMIADMEIPVPSIEEQVQISRYLEDLDHLITLHQRKCEEIKKLKKYMLQKLFPQNGQKNPEIRFNGYTDDWEQRKLRDLVDIYDGVHQTPEYQDFGIMFLSVENITTLKSEKYISEEAFERDYKVYPVKGDILMTRIGDVGTTNVVETTEKVAFYVSLALLKPNEIDSYFLSNAMKTNAFQKGLRERTLVTAIPKKINKDEIGKVDISITNNDEEQQKIGAYFSNLDHLITLHQRKCEKLKKLKKYMLQKMFV